MSVKFRFLHTKLGYLNTKKVVITGGPGTGKSSIIKELIHRGYCCFEEISRQVTLDAQKAGIDQLFLTNPLLFSERLLKGREKQFDDASKAHLELAFLDRGIPDVLAYMDYIGDPIPQHFMNSCNTNMYDMVFILSPWEAIYSSDNERYETFEQALEIHKYLTKTYAAYHYDLIDVPFDTIANRTDFILNAVAV